jgi:hypothetical protein
MTWPYTNPALDSYQYLPATAFSAASNVYYSGTDPASVGPNLYADMARMIPQGFVYYDASMSRLGLATNANVIPYGGATRSFPNGPPGSGASMTDIAAYNQERLGLGDPTLGESGPPNQSFLDSIPTNYNYTNPLKVPGQVAAGLANINVSLIVIVIAVILLAIAAYSLIIPAGARSQIATSFLAK